MTNRICLLIILLCFAVLFAMPADAQAASGFTRIANGVAATTYTDAGCPLQSTCYYQVTALDASGFESIPATCGTTQLCVGGNQVVASMPSSGTHTVALTWTASTTTGATYNVYRHIGPLPPSNATATVN